MKRQLGLTLLTLALLCAPAMWAQSGSTDSSGGSLPQSAPPPPTETPQGTFIPNNPTDNPQPANTPTPDKSGNTAPATNNDNPPPAAFTPNPAANPTANTTPEGFTPTGNDASGGGGGASDNTPQQVTGPQPAFTHPEQLPSLSSLNEVTANTGMQLTVATGISGDSNAAGSSNATDWLGLASLAGTFGITQIRPHLNWSLNYGGGTQIPIGGANYPNIVTQTGQGGLLWQLGSRWQLTANDSYYYSSDPFEPYLTINSLPTFNNPNPTVYIPNATSQGNTGTLDLTYLLGPHDTLDFSGFENFLRYQQSVQSLQNSYMWAGSAFYQHMFSAQLGAGGGYEFSALDFGHGQSRAGVQTFQGFISYKVNPAITIAGWVGPEVTHTKDIVPLFCIPGYGCIYQTVHENVFNVAEGANFTWVGSHSAFRAKFSHRVTNGGGLLGAVELYLVSAEYQRPIGPKWSFHSGLLFGKNTSISAFHENEYLNSITAQAGVLRNLNPAWTLNIYYAIIDQRQNNVPGYLTPQWIDNRIAVSLQYNWGHSLGR